MFAEELNKPHTTAQIAHSLCRLDHKRGNSEMALTWCERAHEQAKALGDRNLLASMVVYYFVAYGAFVFIVSLMTRVHRIGLAEAGLGLRQLPLPA